MYGCVDFHDYQLFRLEAIPRSLVAIVTQCDSYSNHCCALTQKSVHFWYVVVHMPLQPPVYHNYYYYTVELV